MEVRLYDVAIVKNRRQGLLQPCRLFFYVPTHKLLIIMSYLSLMK